MPSMNPIILPCSPIIIIISCNGYNGRYTYKQLINIVYSMSNQISSIRIIDSNYFMWYSLIQKGSTVYHSAQALFYMWIKQHGS